MTGLGPKLLDPLRISFVHITSLNLSNNGIQFLTPSIGLLRSLNSLNLGYAVRCVDRCGALLALADTWLQPFSTCPSVAFAHSLLVLLAGTTSCVRCPSRSVC